MKQISFPSFSLTRSTFNTKEAQRLLRAAGKEAAAKAAQAAADAKAAASIRRHGLRVAAVRGEEARKGQTMARIARLAGGFTPAVLAEANSLLG